MYYNSNRMVTHMIYFIENIIDLFTNIMMTMGPISGFLIVIIESIVPILPLAAFIALNMIVFGPIPGFLISWIGTVIGCVISFYIFRKGFSKILYRNLKIDGKVNKFMGYVSNLSLTSLVLLMVLPFTPAFMFNIAGGLSKIPFRKFFIAVFIGKLSIVYFWGYVGTSFIESIRNPIVLFELSIMMSLAYIITLLVQKKLR